MSNYDSVEKIWSGPIQPPLYNPEASVGYLILNNLKTTPERVIQVNHDTGVEMNGKELYERSIKMIKYLKTLGLAQNDVVGILANSSENLYATVIACLTLGLPINPLSHLMETDDLVFMWSMTKPKIIICGAAFIDVVKEAVDLMKSDCKIITLESKVEGYQFIDDFIDNEDKEIDKFIIPSIKNAASTTAFILCSSGTTARVKGILKTHSQLILNINPIIYQSHEHTEVMPISPILFYWASTIHLFLYTTLYGFKGITTSKPFSADVYMDMVDRHQVTFTFVYPAVHQQVKASKLARPMKSVKNVYVGGCLIRQDVVDSLAEFYPNAKIRGMYATTEVDIISISYLKPKGTSSGCVFPNDQIKIVDDDGNSLGVNERGEICTKVNDFHVIYYENPEKNNEALKDGWFYTGDIGYFDDEGYLFVIDRKLDFIRYYGTHFSPLDIEIVIDTMEGVIASVVVPVSIHGNDFTYAFVIKKPDSTLSSEAIVEYVNSRVSDYKKLRGGAYFVDKFPVTSSGKIKRYELRIMAEKIHKKNDKDLETKEFLSIF